MARRARPVEPFVIVAGLRTGSTLLSTSLDQHPSIRCYGELFHERDFPDNKVPHCDRHRLAASAVLAHVLRPHGTRRTIGFRAMLSHPVPARCRWASLWHDLAHRPRLRVIHLERRDKLAQYASLMIAHRTGVFHPSPDCPAPTCRPSVRIDAAQFQIWAEEQKLLRLHRERILAGHLCMRIYYEDLTRSWRSTIRTLLDFLGVPNSPLVQTRAKQEQRPLCEVIVNYDEIVSSCAAFDG